MLYKNHVTLKSCYTNIMLQLHQEDNHQSTLAFMHTNINAYDFKIQTLEI